MLSPEQLLHSVTEHCSWHLGESANKADRNSSPVTFTSPIFTYRYDTQFMDVDLVHNATLEAIQ